MFPKYDEICPEGALELEFEISDTEVYENGSFKLIDAARRMECATQKHLALFDIDKPQLSAAGKSWVISWSEINVKRLPKAGEKIFLRIWPCKNKTMMYSRKYAFFDSNKEAIISASSLFILMDQTTRKMTAMPEGVKPVPIVEVADEPGYPKMTVKQPFDPEKEIKKVVTADEIDSNGHLNNAYYIGWSEDLFRECKDEKQEIKKLWIQYTKELKEGQEVTLKYDAKNGAFFVRGISDGAESFMALIEF